VGFDEGKEVLKYDRIKLIHLAGGSKELSNKIRFFLEVRKVLNHENYDFILVNYFIGCSIIRLFTRNKITIDIRTSYIFRNKFRRLLYNIILSCESRLFKNISVISEGLANYLHLPARCHILPLGAPLFPKIHKNFNSLKIIYVGTFHQRNISNTIFAFAKFFREFCNDIPMHYTIIGFGSEDDIVKIRTSIETEKMTDSISYLGAIRYPELTAYLNNHNIGMSYIPIEDHYDNQPPTKTFEYLLSGMAVIATGTRENQKVINYSNGIIINDSIEDIYFGLKEIFNRRTIYDTEQIQINARKYSWEDIVTKNLIPYIENNKS